MITQCQEMVSVPPDRDAALEGAFSDIGEVYVLSNAECAVSQPVHAGIPFAQGRLRHPGSMMLTDFSGANKPVQAEVLARWPDGSVKWLLLDAVCSNLSPGGSVWRLRSSSPQDRIAKNWLRCQETAREITIDTGAAVFTLDKQAGSLLRQVACGGHDLLSLNGLAFNLTDARGRACKQSIERIHLEASGPVRATVAIEGRFRGRAPCRFVTRLCFFNGTGLMRVRLTIHNPRRARHRGGLWDLNDAGSIFLRELSLGLNLQSAKSRVVKWIPQPCQGVENTADSFEIYQDSSGGEAWQSRNHVDFTGQTPCMFQGYRVRHNEGETTGHRANPIVALRTSVGTVSVAIAEFWQQFPKAIEAKDALLKLSLFPSQSLRPHELQGGEQKTHTCWFHFAENNGDGMEALSWVHQPAWLVAAPECFADSGVFKYLGVHDYRPDHRFNSLLANALEGDDSLVARRETIDEYGWRHFGDLYADHEQAHYSGPQPINSHYNNQYDVVLGTLLHYLRTGDRRWWEIADPLARHVVDIDIYHTNQDKPAYNGGLFWHTDHYKDAATATHRCYSRTNQAPGKSYGGGPCNEHNYTSGLLLYYYLTGDPNARDAVLSLADWVIRLDDGTKTLFGLVDDEPSGAASCTTESSYHGPGRGCGNSINVLLDGWLLTGDAKYLRKAEELIQRSIHPNDDIEGKDLLNVELRWSYTVFLAVLARYLDLKAEAKQLDSAYAYAQASLLHYAGWMLEHEVAYFEDPSKLEYPTETWGAQELRKANIFRLAALHTEEPLRAKLLERGRVFAERAWSDLFRFDRPGTTRALAIVLTEGLKDAVFRHGYDQAAPKATDRAGFGSPGVFVSQRQRVAGQVKSISGIASACLNLANPFRWYRYLSRSSKNSC